VHDYMYSIERALADLDVSLKKALQYGAAALVIKHLD
jgi:hypothetical protein